MAQEKYGFFNSSGEDIRSYDAGDMAAAFSALASGGVADTGGCLQVTAEGATMRTLIGYGAAMVQGYYYQLKDDGGGLLAFDHATEASLSRIDRIVLRLDLTARTITLAKRIGTAASTPAPPDLTRDAETYELSLAQVLVRAGAAEILSSDITDEREDDAVCGLIAPESLRRGELLSMMDDAAAAATQDMLRHSEQMLSAAQQTQARQNIDAQQAITASGLLKGDGAAVSAAQAGVEYALPVTEITATLAAASWSGSAAPYTQTVAVPGMTATAKGVSAGLAAAATTAQYLAAAAAMLHATAQGDGSITVTAEGAVPTVDLPLLVRIAG